MVSQDSYSGFDQTMAWQLDFLAGKSSDEDGPHGWTERDMLASLSTLQDPSPYLKGDYLGCGGWSQVHKVLRKADGKVFAGKSSRSMKQLTKEASIIRTLTHAHILKFIDWYEEKECPQATLLITELCPEGNLQTLVDHGSCGMNRGDVLQVIHQISGALEFLHNTRRYHSDIKPRNILIRKLKPMDVVLADMADVKHMDPRNKPVFRGTSLYASPEAARLNRHCGSADDIWALGITLLAMVEQSPKVVCTKTGLKEYPAHCFNHVEQLKAINPSHDLVGLLGKMVVWKESDRAAAADCGRIASELLVMGPQQMDHDCEERQFENKLGIKAPEGFQAITFW